jgi:hypothetical protein
MIYKRGCDKKGPNRTCTKCGKRRACGVYWYKFMWQGKLVRESTKQGNDSGAPNGVSARTPISQLKIVSHNCLTKPTPFPPQFLPSSTCEDP